MVIGELANSIFCLFSMCMYDCCWLRVRLLSSFVLQVHAAHALHQTLLRYLHYTSSPINLFLNKMQIRTIAQRIFVIKNML